MYRIFLLFFLLFSSLHAQDEYELPYQLGDGIKLPFLPLYIGGYISTDYQKTDTTDRYRVDDVAVLAYGDYQKFSYMMEFEFKEFYTITDSPAGRKKESDKKLHTERLYVDYAINENFTLKAGKYNTPIGYWNLLPVNVLQDTTSKPVSNSIVYPTFSTGTELSYNAYLGEGSEIEMNLILQKSEDFDATYNNYITDEHYGFGLTYTKDDLSFKINTGVFHNILDQRERHYYYLLSSRYENDTYQLTTEIGTQSDTDGIKTEYAGFSQLVYHLTEQHSAILRVESYSDRLKNEQDNLAVFAYSYRPVYPVAFKSEYQVHSMTKRNQFLLSFSVMF